MKLPDGPLVHERLRLEPLAPEHRPGLLAVGGDPDLFRWWPRAMAGDAFTRTLDWLEAEIAAGRWRAFTVIAPDGRILGPGRHREPRRQAPDAGRGVRRRG